MIKSFKHQGLKKLYGGRTTRGVAAKHVKKLKDILYVLNQSRRPDDMDLPGFQLHVLKGDMKGHYAVSVSGNWRVTFRFEGESAVDVNYKDYH